MQVPSQCQSIEDEIAELEASGESLKGLAGVENWAALQYNVRPRSPSARR